MALCVSCSECIWFRVTNYHFLTASIFTLLLQGHGHWINSLALSTEYVLRTGAFDHTGRQYPPNEEKQKVSFSLHSTLYISFVLYHDSHLSLWKICWLLFITGARKIQQNKRGFPWKISLRFWWFHYVPLGTIC